MGYQCRACGFAYANKGAVMQTVRHKCRDFSVAANQALQTMRATQELEASVRRHGGSAITQVLEVIIASEVMTALSSTAPEVVAGFEVMFDWPWKVMGTIRWMEADQPPTFIEIDTRTFNKADDDGFVKPRSRRR